MPEAIRHCLGHAEDFDGYTFDRVRLNALPQQTVCEAHNTNARTATLRCPVLGPDCHPDSRRQLVCQTVERQRRDETHNALGHPLRGLRQAVVRIQVGVWKLIDAPRQADDLTGPLHTTHRRRRHAGLAQLDQAHNPSLPQKSLSQVTLQSGFRH